MEAILKTGKAPIDVLVNGITALVVAADLMQPALIEVLLRYGADPNLRVGKERWYYDNSPEAEIKLESQSDNGLTAVHALAGIQGHNLLWDDRKRGAECLKLLVDAGADVNARTVREHTALHYACKKRSIPGFVNDWGSDKTDEILAELLLQHGADPNARCDSGATPLHKIAPERPKLLDILVQNGADVNARDYGGRTPLLSALATITSS